jgi:hypothetical protein
MLALLALILALVDLPQSRSAHDERTLLIRVNRLLRRTHPRSSEHLRLVSPGWTRGGVETTDAKSRHDCGHLGRAWLLLFPYCKATRITLRLTASAHGCRVGRAVGLIAAAP